jgi:hypothetical protein
MRVHVDEGMQATRASQLPLVLDGEDVPWLGDVLDEGLGVLEAVGMGKGVAQVAPDRAVIREGYEELGISERERTQRRGPRSIRMAMVTRRSLAR